MTLIGQMLGQYQITERIGTGGMGTVYKAYQSSLDRDVAIKVLPAQHALTPGFKERFIREAKAVAHLSHPNILPVFDFGIKGDLSYFVMKYVPGRTLKHLLGQAMDLMEISHFIDQLAGALDHAHEHGILHRDIKPANILMEGEWLLLTDFGLAKVGGGAQGITGTGMVMGTPAYVSPEQAEGKAVDHRTDIYSLGVLLYEMVTGRTPFQADSAMGVLFKHIYEAPPSPCDFNPKLPKTVEQIILKALAKNPDERYNRAGDLAQALKLYLSSLTETIVLDTASPAQTARYFISYKRSVVPDEALAMTLYNALTEQGHNVFIDRTLRAGDNWLQNIDEQIKNSDFLVVLLSETSADSEMVQAEVHRAYEYRKLQGRPHILPIRVAFEGLLPYSIDAFLDPLQYLIWRNETDTPGIIQGISEAAAGQFPNQTPFQTAPVLANVAFSEDGRPMTDSESLSPPLSEFDPRLLDALTAPGGVVKLKDRFYIERPADNLLKREIIKAGTTTTIRASRQTGKSSLLVRGVNFARQQGARVVTLDLQRIDTDRLTAPELFLRDLAELMVRKLRLDVAEVDKAWRGSLGPQDKLTYFMEDYILPEVDQPIVLALDEIDRLLQTPFHSDFFALLRSWHNSRALDEAWDKLNIVMVISTEPYLLIADVNQSPFNVGLKLYLDDFDETQVSDMNLRHGSPVSQAHFPQLMELMGGHPYLNRKAFYTLVTEDVTWPELMKIAADDQGPFGDHLRRQHWLLRDEPALQAALKHVIANQSCPNESALFRLLQAGLVKGSGARYTCRCGLYRLYFADKLE